MHYHVQHVVPQKISKITFHNALRLVHLSSDISEPEFLLMAYTRYHDRFLINAVYTL